MTPKTTLMAISLALSVAIGLVLSRGGGEAHSDRPSDGKVLIGLSLDTLKEARWQGDRDVFVARAQQLGAEVLVQSANGDDTRQMSDVEALISRHVKVLVIVPHDGTAMAKAVRMAHEAGIGVIAYDRMIRGADVDLYLSFDNVHVGELQARYLADRLPSGRPMRVVRIYGSKTDNNAFLFKQGQDKVLQPYLDRGAIEVVHEDWADDWKPENGKKITNAAITKLGSKIDAVLASNDGLAGGAIQALLEEGLAGKVLVTGQDAELVACQRIAGGTQAMTIYKPLKTLATEAAEIAVRMATGKVVVARQAVANGTIDVPAVLSEVVTVDKDNLMATVVQDGFHRREDIYRDAAR